MLRKMLWITKYRHDKYAVSFKAKFTYDLKKNYTSYFSLYVTPTGQK